MLETVFVVLFLEQRKSLDLLHQKWASVFRLLPFRVSGFGWVWVLFDPRSLGLHLGGNAEIGYLSARGWAFPFSSWQCMLFSWAVDGSFSSDGSVSIISGFGESISYLVHCTWSVLGVQKLA